MKIIVGIKRVVDYNVKVRLAEKDGVLALDLAHLKMSINPFDEIALEEAVRLREKGAAREVVAVSVGTKASHDVLRTAMALGADRALLAEAGSAEYSALEPLHIARIFAKIVQEERADLVLLGKQSIDGDNNQTGQILAGLLGWGQASFASAVQIKNGEARVERETDKGAEILAVPLPAVITADLRLNEPRYASLPNIMKARKKPIEQRNLADLALDLTPQTEVLALSAPPARKAGVMLKNVDELVRKLRAEGVIA